MATETGNLDDFMMTDFRLESKINRFTNQILPMEATHNNTSGYLEKALSVHAVIRILPILPGLVTIMFAIQKSININSTLMTPYRMGRVGQHLLLIQQPSLVLQAASLTHY